MIYFDNASTSFPKPEVVAKAVYEYISAAGVNINRGGYTSAYEAADMVFECRELLKNFFHASDSRNVVFTKNITESLNVILKGFLKPGDHILCSSMEHNAVMRPLVQLERYGVSFDRIPCREDGSLILEEMAELLHPNTKAVVMTAASNVCGTVMPLKDVGCFCKKHGLRFFVDSAQAAGVLDLDMDDLHADALCFTGHKSLLGPQGIGGFILSDEMVREIEPLISGGTGSISHSEAIPDFMPDRFEAGTLNLPGIAGLKASISEVMARGTEEILKHELCLTEAFLEGLKGLSGVHPVGINGTQGRIGVVSIVTEKVDASEIAYRLDSAFGIQTRVGLHCAPMAHKTLGTFPTGTIRFSFGIYNTPEQVQECLQALKEVLYGI